MNAQRRKDINTVIKKDEAPCINILLPSYDWKLIQSLLKKEYRYYLSRINRESSYLDQNDNKIKYFNERLTNLESVMRNIDSQLKID